MRSRSEPLVVKVTSRIPSISTSPAMSLGSSRRSSGSPPVMRILLTPSPANTRERRVISSKDRSSRRGRNAHSRPNTSLGMQ